MTNWTPLASPSTQKAAVRNMEVCVEEELLPLQTPPPVQRWLLNRREHQHKCVSSSESWELKSFYFLWMSKERRVHCQTDPSSWGRWFLVKQTELIRVLNLEYLIKIMTLNASQILRHVGGCWSARQRSLLELLHVSAHVQVHKLLVFMLETQNRHILISWLSGRRAPVQLQLINLFIIS